MSEVKIGVVVPMYGVSRYLNECLDSIIAQSYENLSVILVSDGDKECLDIAMHYVKKDSRFILVYKDNGGQASARNVGIELFSNKYNFLESKIESNLSCYKILESKNCLTYIYIYICYDLCDARCAMSLAAKNSESIKVAVVIPIYNVEKYLKECLDSVISQTYKNIEVILVNDGSTDDTSLNIAMEYVNTDSRFKLIDKPNLGLSSARNAGLEYLSNEYTLEYDESLSIKENEYINNLLCYKVTGYNPYNINAIYANKNAVIESKDSNTLQIPKIDYLIFLDSDDYWVKDCIQKCVEALDEVAKLHKKVEFIWFGFECVYDEIKYFPCWDYLNICGFMKSQLISTQDLLQRFIERKFDMFPIAVQALMDFNFIKSIHLKYEDRIYAEDQLFGVLLLVQSSNVYVLKEKPYIYRIRPNSSSNKEGERKMTKDSIFPYLRHIYDIFNQDVIYTKRYFVLSSWFITFEKALNFLNEYAKKGEIESIKANLAKKAFLTKFANECIPLGDLAEDPLNVIDRLPLIKPYITDTRYLKKFKKMAIYNPKLYKKLKSVNIFYRNYREKKKRGN